MLYITIDASLLPLNTFGINGYAKYLVETESPEDINKLLCDPAYKYIIVSGLKPIGQGSNLLFAEDHYDGALLKYVSKRVTVLEEYPDSIVMSVDAGVLLDELIAGCCMNNWWGLENLSLIPGTIGAAAVQNVGAYGVEFKDSVIAVNCYDLEKNGIHRFEADEIAYSYRDSIFKHAPEKERYIIISVEIRLSKKPKPQLDYSHLSDFGKTNDIGEIRNKIIAMRRSKLPKPNVIGNAGSFFKNPILTNQQFADAISTAKQNTIDISGMPVFDVAGRKKLSAAWLIDKAGWKGVTEHHAGVWFKQPLVLINADGKASGKDIVRLAKNITNDITTKFGITLEKEVEYL